LPHERRAHSGEIRRCRASVIDRHQRFVEGLVDQDAGMPDTEGRIDAEPPVITLMIRNAIRIRPRIVMPSDAARATASRQTESNRAVIRLCCMRRPDYGLRAYIGWR
jgi:hypothetical protein